MGLPKEAPYDPVFQALAQAVPALSAGVFRCLREFISYLLHLAVHQPFIYSHIQLSQSENSITKCNTTNDPIVVRHSTKTPE